MRKTLLALLALALMTATAVPAMAETITCASTTSTQNSGLFDYLLPIFKDRTGIDVKVVAVGTGAALEIARRGDADVVLVHAKGLELQAVAEGYTIDRREVMYNDFILLGPKADPVGVKAANSAKTAFERLAAGKAGFVSRGDKSGTHTKELALWKEAGAKPEGNAWYLEVGQGMEKTIRIANEKQAYTLSDRGTWLAIGRNCCMDMDIMFEGDTALFNQYGVMLVNPALHKHVKQKEAMVFLEWLISNEGQAAIGAFKDKKGNRMFVPNYK